MAVVSRTSIKSLIDKGDIVVYPQTDIKIGNCSIDFRLGEWFFREKESGPIYPYLDGRTTEFSQDESNSGIDLHPWNPEPQKALPGILYSGVPHETHIIHINPGETILITTEEFIGSRVECTTMAKTKSTLARMCLDLCGSSGWGDIGYVNRWAFPLHNRSKHTILLRPGTWIGQIVFLKVTDKEVSYTQGGNYQNTDDFESLVKNWDPRSVLPKALSCTPNNNLIIKIPFDATENNYNKFYYNIVMNSC